MLKILFLLIFPSIAYSQINRSATELAKENIEEYLVTKIFKERAYRAVSYGELKSYKGNNREIIWTIRHECEIGKAGEDFDKSSSNPSVPFSFFLYLDRKLKVVRADSDQLY